MVKNKSFSTLPPSSSRLKMITFPTASPVLTLCLYYAYGMSENRITLLLMLWFYSIGLGYTLGKSGT